jgi:hypothetical protein
MTINKIRIILLVFVLIFVGRIKIYSRIFGELRMILEQDDLISNDNHFKKETTTK